MYTVLTAFAIWALLNLLFFLLARYLDARHSQDECRQKIVPNVPGIAILTFFVAYFAGGMVAESIGDKLPTKTIVANTTELVAMNSTTSISGSFFLGCGYIDGETVYQIYVRNADGSASPDRVWADRKTRIVEDQSLHNKGYLKEMELVRDQSSKSKWAIVEDNGLLDSWDEFDVPSGTVVQNFSLK